MNVRDLIPWSRGSSQLPSSYRDDDMDPFLSLHRNVNRLFDEVFRGFAPPSLFGGTALSMARGRTWRSRRMTTRSA
ncbi:hypothetical protein ABIA23_005419 [Sinorhizobium fredii]